MDQVSDQQIANNGVPVKIRLLKYFIFALYIILPFAGFWAGMKYQQNKPTQSTPVETGLRPVSTISPTSVQNQVPDGTWKTYRNEEYGFEFEYPPEYREISKENLTETAQLAYFKAEDNSEFSVLLDDGAFSLEYLRKYAPTGAEGFNPEKITIADKTFYYYGPGGGGVCYPDQYFINVNNKVLLFKFFALCENDKTPPEYIKNVASHILSTFRFTNENSELSCNTDNDCVMYSTDNCCGRGVANRDYAEEHGLNMHQICTAVCQEQTAFCINSVCTLR